MVSRKFQACVVVSLHLTLLKIIVVTMLLHQLLQPFMLFRVEHTGHIWINSRVT